MAVSRVGRLAPACHVAALAVGLVGTFLPVLSLSIPLPMLGAEQRGPGITSIEWSLWEASFAPELDELVRGSLLLLMPRAAVAAGGPILVLALLVLAVGGVFARLAGRDGGVWVGRARFTSAMGAGAVAAAVGVCVAQARAMTGDVGLPRSMADELRFQTGPGVVLLMGAAVLAVVAAVATLRVGRPAGTGGAPTETDSAEMDTPPMGLRLPDDGPQGHPEDNSPEDSDLEDRARKGDPAL
ncbi:hypothetical protein ACTG9Q_29990 [Actinokineospora sp. 24-640]